MADAVPGGFEIYETPNGQVYLRKKKPVRIQPTELVLVEEELQRRQTSQHCYLVEVSDDKLIIHEGDPGSTPCVKSMCGFQHPGWRNMQSAMRTTCP